MFITSLPTVAKVLAKEWTFAKDFCKPKSPAKREFGPCRRSYNLCDSAPKSRKDGERSSPRSNKAFETGSNADDRYGQRPQTLVGSCQRVDRMGTQAKPRCVLGLSGLVGRLHWPQ